MRGKILNVEKAQLVKVLDNEEIAAIFKAIGVTPGGELEDAAKRRYGKIILMTDADVDGSHIRTLLLTFIFRHMRPLVEQGCIYIAQPPLYRVVQRKQTRYVQTAEEMTKELIELGLNGTSLKFTDGAVLDGETLRKIVELIGELEEPLLTLERRGIDLRYLAIEAPDRARAAPALPRFSGTRTALVHRQAAARPVPRRAGNATGPRVAGRRRQPAGPADRQQGALQRSATARFWKTVTTRCWKSSISTKCGAINHVLQQLAGYGIKINDLLSAGTKDGLPVQPFTLDSDGEQIHLSSLRDILIEIRKLGEKGLKLTRFKGLGEMNSDELGITAMDPKSRTLLQVTMQDAVAADEIFRVLMGDHVEPRREFIEKHALDVKDLDV